MALSRYGASAYPEADERIAFDQAKGGRYSSLLLQRLYLWRFVLRNAPKHDVILVRYLSLDPFGPIFQRIIGNIVLIHHSKSDEDLRSIGRIGLAKLESISLWLARRHAKMAVGVTSELSGDFASRGSRALPEMVYANGIDTEEIQKAEDNRHRDGTEILFVASKFYPWQGLERLINAAESWEESPESREALRIHLVGVLTDEQEDRLNEFSGKRVSFVRHGMLDQSEIKKLAASTDVALGSLALDLKGMTEACTLKVREYLALGLPVYATHSDSALPSEFPFFRVSKEVDISEIIRLRRDTQAVSRELVRDTSVPYLSKRSAMLDLAKSATSTLSS